MLASGSRSTTQLLAMHEIAADIADLNNDNNEDPRPAAAGLHMLCAAATTAAGTTIPAPPVPSQSSRQSRQTTMDSFSHPVLKDAYELAWAEFIYESSVPFNVLNTPSFMRLEALMMKNMKIPFKAPTPFLLRTRLLDNVYDTLKADTGPLIKETLVEYGGSLLLDGASSINGMSYIHSSCLVLHCSSQQLSLFLYSFIVLHSLATSLHSSFLL
jgi:hypothetical protein